MAVARIGLVCADRRQCVGEWLQRFCCVTSVSGHVAQHQQGQGAPFKERPFVQIEEFSAVHRTSGVVRSNCLLQESRITRELMCAHHQIHVAVDVAALLAAIWRWERLQSHGIVPNRPDILQRPSQVDQMIDAPEE